MQLKLIMWKQLGVMSLPLISWGGKVTSYV